MPAKRKRKPPTTWVVTFHVTKDEHEEIRLLAHRLGRSVADVGRYSLLVRAMRAPVAREAAAVTAYAEEREGRKGKS